MQICYIDESGDLGGLPLSPEINGNNQPVFAIAGIFIDSDILYEMTHEFISLKKRFYPHLNYKTEFFLDAILPEIKGADVRRNALRGRRKVRRHAIGFIDKFLMLFIKYNVQFVGRVWVKKLGCPFDGRAVYSSSTQNIYEHFEAFLKEKNKEGICIADSRNQMKNVRVSHSVFTQKFQAETPLYPHVTELPLFSHSNNHMGIQLCDLLCSALLFPLASYLYCHEFVHNVHVQERAIFLRERYGERLRSLQYRYKDERGFYKGGLSVSDPVGHKSTMCMFQNRQEKEEFTPLHEEEPNRQIL